MFTGIFSELFDYVIAHWKAQGLRFLVLFYHRKEDNIQPTIDFFKRKRNRGQHEQVYIP